VVAVLSPRDVLSFLATKLDLEGLPAAEVAEVADLPEPPAAARDQTRTAGG
jgi:hypothetical protein